MNENSRWLWFLTGRILVHALVGGIFCALCGAILIAISGALVGFVLEPSFMNSIAPIGAAIGLLFGGISGAIFGIIALGVVGFFSPPRREYRPTKRILGSILRYMSFATAGAMATYVLVDVVAALFEHQSFQESAIQGLGLIMYGAPFVMSCGIIPGAIVGCRLEKLNERQMPVATDRVTLIEAG